MLYSSDLITQHDRSNGTRAGTSLVEGDRSARLRSTLASLNEALSFALPEDVCSDNASIQSYLLNLYRAIVGLPEANPG